MTIRKILLNIVLILVLVGSAIFIIKGIDKLNIVGITGLSAKSNEIDERNLELSNLIGTKYENALANLRSTANTMNQSKTEYENQAILSDSNTSSYISQQERYNIDYLWTKLGNYAKDEGVVIKIELTSNESSSKLYNLNFTVTGHYVGITDFIYDIENDSKLGFKIDNFKITGEESLTATFSCKEIPISVGQIETSTDTESTTENEADTNNSDNKNETKNDNTTNSSNS